MFTRVFHAISAFLLATFLVALADAPVQAHQASSAFWKTPNQQMQVSESSLAGCALNSGKAYCWGELDWYSVPTPSQVGSSTTWTKLSGATSNGEEYVCGISSGKLYCWGSGNRGQLGLGNNTSYFTPQQVGSLTTWTAIATDYNNTGTVCGIAGGALYCWGSTGSTTPLQVGSSTTWTAITTNWMSSCGIDAGAMYCWSNGSSPVQVGTSATWTAISMGMNDRCGIDSGKLFCWGSNANGQDGVGSTSAVATPTQVGSATNWTMISSGDGNTCGISGGALYCWGANANGENGTGDLTQHTSPVQVGVATNWTSIDASGSTVFGVAGGKVYTWGGGNTFLNFPQTQTPTQFGAMTTWAEMHGLGGDVCGLAAGALYCWGQNYSGTAGNGLSVNNSTAIAVNSSTNWAAISENFPSYNGVSVCGLTTAGQLYCWGNNQWGQLGLGSTSFTYSPSQVGTSKTWSVISQGGRSTCGISAGKLYCWGDNTWSQLGLGNTTQYTTPQQVGSATNWTAVSVQQYYSYYGMGCGIAGGKLYCWGDNTYGELGIGSTTSSSVPVQVGAFSNWTSISVGIFEACGIAGGSVYCWGRNDYGVVGVGNTTQYTTPQQVGTSKYWTQVSVSMSTACGINSGKLFCWGSSHDGQAGLGTNNTTYSTPQQVGTATTWTSIFTGGDDWNNNGGDTCGISAGKLYCWGGNWYGADANDYNEHDSPMQLGTSVNW